MADTWKLKEGCATLALQLPIEMKRDLKAYARSEGRTMEWVVRDAVRRLLEEQWS